MSNSSDSSIVAAAAFLSDNRRNARLRTLRESVAGTDLHTLKVAAGAYQASLAITRPANTTAYTAADVIGVADSGTPANAGSAIHEFAGIGPKGGHVRLTASTLRVNLSAVTSGMTSFALHLYNAAPTAILDNAAFDLPSGDRAAYLGSIALGTPADLGSTLFIANDAINKHVKLAPGSTSLYALLVTAGAYTPTSGEVFAVTLSAVDVIG